MAEDSLGETLPMSIECVHDAIGARNYKPMPRFYHTSAQMASKVVVYSGRTQDYSKQNQNRLASTVEVFGSQNGQ